MSRIRSTSRRLTWILQAALLATNSGLAATPNATIDDSGTVVVSPTVWMRWQAPSPRQANNILMTGATTVRVRLNVAPWLRRSGRIYIVLPAQHPGSIRATWTTQGRLLAGQVLSGGRSLVYSGPISMPFFEDSLQLAIVVDGRQMHQAYDLGFHFEMETI